MELYEVDSGHKVGNWLQARYGRRLKVGEVEVEAHDAGHVLGSAQYEVITLEGNLVYASHINFTDTLLSRAAEVAPCDLLVIEATYPSATRNALRDSVVADIVKWTLECIKDQRIPALVASPIGDAQELIRLFNLWTEIPVIVHPRIARINKIYESHGIGLRYLDASTDEAVSMIEQARCVVIVPRRFDTTRYGNFKTAYVSGWATKYENNSQKFFPLSMQADLNQLLRYVEEARPKTVLTFYGASELFAQMVSKRLGVPARQLTTERIHRKPQAVKVNEKRVLAFQEILMGFMDTPGFAYEKRDIMALGLKEGFRSLEIEEALLRLTKRGELKYVQIVDGYTLPSA